MTTVNGRYTLKQARAMGELANWTGCQTGEMTVWILVDADNGGWLDRVRQVTVTLTLRQGYGSESHLFDRSLATIASAVEGRLFASLTAIRQAIRAVRIRESLGFAVELAEAGYYEPVPAELSASAEQIRAAAATKAATKARRERRRFAASLVVLQGEDGRYRVTTAAAHAAARWVDGASRYWCCAGLDSRSGAAYVGISSPNNGYATAAEAEAALRAVREAL